MFALHARAETYARSSSAVYPDLHGVSAIQSVDVVGDGDVLHALIAGTREGLRQGLFYLRSRDGGLHWEAPVNIGMAADKPLQVRRGNDARLAVAGNRLLAVWQEQRDMPGNGPLQSAVSDDGGRTWRIAGYPVKGDSAKNQAYAGLAADSQGRMHLVWLDDREENGNTSGLRYAVTDNGGQSWQQEQTVDPLVCTCCWNRIQMLDDQSVAVLYRSAEPHDMKLALRPGAGGQWRKEGAVGRFDWHFAGCPHNGGGLALTRADGKTLLHGVVWTGKDEAAGLYYLQSADAGTHWSTPQRIGDALGRDGDIAGTPAGRLGIVFSRIDRGHSLIHFQSSANAGKEWTAPQIITAADAIADHPVIVTVAGGFRAFWTERRLDAGKVLGMSVIN
ncbi:exo-alpha-sialidase [Candidatus Methylospira mobilis]|uniref:exo-alpha-sialidase n=1 Tax=Candidatus Methylospira mobilis TaxID=1808979 RepID=A0A5Q0BHP2_9GAMM|nr:sialidase family protein [Candidatus Methylospira mobilis]QFY43395.1 exo-alpha-sialidase [Candidatus Methylospira mobilis]WNV03368.1 sialidase family protein [Candidatus Methylospira mobilis]